MFKFTLLLFFTLCSCCTYSSTYAVWQTNIQVYVQSETSSSTAHMIQSENGIYSNGDHPWCGRRAYIDFADKGLLSAALAAAMAKQKVNFIYEDAAANKVVQAHTNTKCKVISIFSSF